MSYVRQVREVYVPGVPGDTGERAEKSGARGCLEGVATDYLTDNQLYVPVGKADAVYIKQTG